MSRNFIKNNFDAIVKRSSFSARETLLEMEDKRKIFLRVKEILKNELENLVLSESEIDRVILSAIEFILSDMEHEERSKNSAPLGYVK